ncbi:hypothetical protein MRX96_038167 [Rhipicephalus microplus]
MASTRCAFSRGSEGVDPLLVTEERRQYCDVVTFGVTAFDSTEAATPRGAEVAADAAGRGSSSMEANLSRLSTGFEVLLFQYSHRDTMVWWQLQCNVTQSLCGQLAARPK